MGNLDNLNKERGGRIEGMRFLVTFGALFIIGSHLPLQSEPAGSWNQFRGPNGSGVALDSRPPLKPGPDSVAWKIPVPTGLSAPVLSENRIFLTGFENGRLVTLAIDKANGKKLWQQQAPKVPIEKLHEANSPASPSALVDRDRVFVYFGSYGMICYDHDGKEIWKKTIPTAKSLYGSSTSPISHGDTLILVLDDDNNLHKSLLSRSRILALKKTNGEVAWETPRPFQRSGWSTPIIWKHDKGEELVILGNGRLCGYDLESGEEQWHVTGFSRETISMPVAGDGVVHASASKRGGAPDAHPDPQPFWDAVIRFDTNGDKKLQRREMTGHFTFPFRPELPLGHSGYGMPLPKDPKQRGKRLDGMFHWMDKDKDGSWTEKEFISNISIGHGKPMLVAVRPGGRGNVTGSHVAWELNKAIPEIPSPIFHGKRIYMVCNGGVLAGVDAGTGKLIYRNRLGGLGQYSASPVIANNHLYLCSEPGLITVAKTGDTFGVVHQHDLGEPIFTTPALDKKTLYIRSKEHLWAFRSGD
jgi:outer membrane protein assembly factor BamB